MSRMIRGRLVRVSSALTFGAAVALMLAAMASATSPIEHRVSVGTPDACLHLAGTHPGCDGNFSLTAIKRTDGSVSGQYTDRFAHGDGFHAVVDCLVVDGNQAWVSGVITSGSFTDPDTGEVFDLAGRTSLQGFKTTAYRRTTHRTKSAPRSLTPSRSPALKCSMLIFSMPPRDK